MALPGASVHTTHSLVSDTDLLCITFHIRIHDNEVSAMWRIRFWLSRAQEREDQATAHFRQPRAYPSAEFALQFERAWEKDVVFQVNVKV